MWVPAARGPRFPHPLISLLLLLGQRKPMGLVGLGVPLSLPKLSLEGGPQSQVGGAEAPLNAGCSQTRLAVPGG